MWKTNDNTEVVLWEILSYQCRSTLTKWTVTFTDSDLCLCVQPEKKDENVYEVCLPPEESALEGGEEKSEETEDGMKKRGVSAMVKIFHFIMKQSYICALIAMMVSQSVHRCCVTELQEQADAALLSAIAAETVQDVPQTFLV